MADRPRRLENLREYLQEVAPDYLKAIDDVSDGNNPIDGDEKITFLLPRKEVRDEFIELAEKDPDNEKITKILYGHILHGVFPKPFSFNETGKQAVSLDDRLLVISSPSTLNRGGLPFVTLANGAQLKYAERFQNTENAAVYEVAEKDLDLNGPKVDHAKLKADKVEGGREKFSANLRMARRTWYAYHLSEKYAHFVYQQVGGEKQCVNPYLTFVLSLLGQLRAKYGTDDTNNPYWVAMSMLDHSPIVSFYLLVEPFRTSEPYIIPTADINDFKMFDILYVATDLYKGLLSEYANKFGNDVAVQRLINYRAGYASKKMWIRNEAVDKRDMDAKEFSRQTGDPYSALKQLLPQKTLEMYASRVGMKVWQDYLRFWIYSKYEGWGQIPQWKSARSNKDMIWNYIVKSVNTIQMHFPGNNYMDELPRASNNVPNSQFNNIIGKMFMPSALYFYVPTVADDKTAIEDKTYADELAINTADGGVIMYNEMIRYTNALRANEIFTSIISSPSS